MRKFIKASAFLAVILAAAISLAACGAKTTINDDGTKTKTEGGVKITETAAKAVQTEKYETADFSMTIPKGWTVTAGGTNIYHSIRISDPNEPLNQMFVLLKADILLHSQAGKDAWQQNYSMGNTQAALFAKAAVLDNPSTEGFFKIFSQYTAFASEVEPAYSGYAFFLFATFLSLPGNLLLTKKIPIEIFAFAVRGQWGFFEISLDRTWQAFKTSECKV